MHIDPLLPPLVLVILAVLVVGLVAHRIGQPFPIGCLLAGVALGPHAFGVLDDPEATGRLGGIGVVFLLFFAGMEIELPRLVARWRVAVLGTLGQIAGSVACTAALGHFLDWPFPRSLLLGFVISLSSTAVVLKLLEDRGERDTETGGDVTAILLSQDLALVPMLLALGFLSGDRVSAAESVEQLAAGVFVLAMFVWMVRRPELSLPLPRSWKESRDMRVFAALLPCLGLALLTGLAGLSSGLGAFLGGVYLAKTRDARWVAESLKPFEAVFLGLFFVSVGMLIDLDFLRAHTLLLLTLLLLVLATNTVLNAVLLRVLGLTWRSGFRAGSLLAQIGEFSFVLAAVGLDAGLISAYGYQATIATIALSLLASPAWIALVRRTMGAPPIGRRTA